MLSAQKGAHTPAPVSGAQRTHSRSHTLGGRRPGTLLGPAVCWLRLTLGRCFMTHITTGCSDGIFTKEKLFSSRSSSFLYLEDAGG